MTVETKTGGDGPAHDTALPGRTPVRALAEALRTVLRHHEQMGVEQYPLTPALRECLRPASARPGPAKSSPAKPPPMAPVRSEPPRRTGGDAAAAQLRAFLRDVEACRLCSLASGRQGVVGGSGRAGAALLVVGDYSAQDTGFSVATLLGRDEDAMLWNMMRAIGLTPEEVYVTNAVKCCPLPTEQPGDESMQCCRGHLAREIELVRPRVVCALGEVAARSFLGSQEPVIRLRGRFHPYRTEGGKGAVLQVMVTFHPRYLLRHAEMKKAAWQDLQMIQRLVQAP